MKQQKSQTHNVILYKFDLTFLKNRLYAKGVIHQLEVEALREPPL